MADQKKTIVEEVLEERNLIIQPLNHTLHEGEDSRVRIEGEVTAEKLNKVQEFSRVFHEATSEITELAVYKAPRAVEDFCEDARVDELFVKKLKSAKTHTLFQSMRNLNVIPYPAIKTRDNKLEPLESYLFRLEKVVLDQVKLKNDQVSKLERDLADALKNINYYRNLSISKSWYLRIVVYCASFKSKIYKFFKKEQ